MKRGKWLICVAAVLTAAVLGWLIWANKALETNTYVVTGDIPIAFDGYRIAQISDLHNATLGKDNQKLLSALRAADPDLIAITGDLVDSRHTNLDVAVAFVQAAVEIAPCYYVPGNHENRISEYPQLAEALADAGVWILADEKTQLQHDGATITLVGIQDPSFHTEGGAIEDETVVGECLSELLEPEDGFVILLSHRPELLQTYEEHGVDLVLSGHAHGGQVRLPWVGGVIAPNQGLFPAYDGGLYIRDGTQMVVSRGLGNSLCPLRVNNRPELVLVELSR